nr:DUF4097 family beta strand repeat-containing protein [Xanthomonas vasicola]
MQLKSVSGDVVAAGRAKEAQLETVSGTLRSTVSSGRMTLGTVSGQLNAPAGASGLVAVESVSGDIRLDAGQVSQLRAQSVSGATAITVAWLAPGGSIAAESVSGTMTLGCRAICRQRWMSMSSAAISARSRAMWNGGSTAPANTSRRRWGPAMATSNWSRIRARCVSIKPTTSANRACHLAVARWYNTPAFRQYSTADDTTAARWPVDTRQLLGIHAYLRAICRVSFAA